MNRLEDYYRTFKIPDDVVAEIFAQEDWFCRRLRELLDNAEMTRLDLVYRLIAGKELK